jgi:hypothetical protein
VPQSAGAAHGPVGVSLLLALPPPPPRARPPHRPCRCLVDGEVHIEHDLRERGARACCAPPRRGGSDSRHQGPPSTSLPPSSRRYTPFPGRDTQLAHRFGCVPHGGAAAGRHACAHAPSGSADVATAECGRRVGDDGVFVHAWLPFTPFPRAAGCTLRVSPSQGRRTPATPKSSCRPCSAAADATRRVMGLGDALRRPVLTWGSHS